MKKSEEIKLSKKIQKKLRRPRKVAKSVKLDPAVKALWVAALRSGDYKQGKDALRPTEDTFCCFGVLCNLHAMAYPEVAKYETDFPSYLHNDLSPPGEVMLWATGDVANSITQLPKVSVPQTKGKPKFDFLANHNDAGVDFLTIAKAIDDQL